MNKVYLLYLAVIGSVLCMITLYFTGRSNRIAKKQEMNWRAKLCPQYKTRYTMGQGDYVMSSRNCSNCRYYAGWSCTKNLLKSAKIDLK